MSSTSFGEPDGLFGINCGHTMRGVSDGTFINREEQYDKEENDEEYKKVQAQRVRERQIRKEKTQADMLEAAGDSEGAKLVRSKAAAHDHELKAYCDSNGLSYRQDRTQVYGYANKVDKSGNGGIIKTGNEKMTISSIDSPIEQKHTGKGNPSAILHFDVELNNRQRELLNAMPDYDSRITVLKDSVNMSDLSALTAKTGDEFAMFTKGGERLVVRGNAFRVNISVEQAAELAAQGYKWSGHTHPGIDLNSLIPSDGDKKILSCFMQEVSVIYNSKGAFQTFDNG